MQHPQEMRGEPAGNSVQQGASVSLDLLESAWALPGGAWSLWPDCLDIAVTNQSLNTPSADCREMGSETETTSSAGIDDAAKLRFCAATHAPFRVAFRAFWSICAAKAFPEKIFSKLMRMGRSCANHCQSASHA